MFKPVIVLGIKSKYYHLFSPQIGATSQPPTSPPCSPEVEDLFSQGFQLKPEKRPTARELLNHRVFVAGAVNHILFATEACWFATRGHLSLAVIKCYCFLGLVH